MKALATSLLLVLLWCGLVSDARACAVATNVQAQVVFNAPQISVLFTRASGVGQYAVQLYQGSSRVTTRYTLGSAATFQLLQPATTYSVRVGSICSPGDTTFTAPVSVTTPSGPTQCPPVTNFALSQVTGSQATLNFAPVSGAISYTVSYWALTDTTTRYTLTIPAPPAQLSNLLSDTRYVVRILTNCGSGTTGLGVSSPFYFQTTGGPVCSAASNVVVVATGPTTAAVSFTPGSGNSGYRVAYFAAGYYPTTYYVSGTSSPIVLTDLQPGQTYYLQLQSQCSSGTSAYTAGGYTAYGFRGTGALAVSSALGTGAVVAFPNPAHHSVTVQLPAVPGANAARLTLLNSLGQVVRTQEVALPTGGAQTELALTDVAPGLYTLRVAAGSQAATQRLAVE